MSDEMKVQTKGFNKKFIFIAITIIVVGLIAVLVFVPKSAKAKKVEEQLDLGAKYLSELDYEQAIVAYEAVIKIDPKCEEAYLALADVYIATGEFYKAEEALKQAEEAIGKVNEEVEKKREEVNAKQKKEEQLAESTLIPTSTPIPEPTVTLTNTPTPTELPSPTPSPSPAPTSTPTPSPSPTSTPSPSPTPTNTPSPTPTNTPSPTPTNTPSPTPTIIPFPTNQISEESEVIKFSLPEEDSVFILPVTVVKAGSALEVKVFSEKDKFDAHISYVVRRHDKESDTYESIGSVGVALYASDAINDDNTTSFYVPDAGEYEIKIENSVAYNPHYYSGTNINELCISYRIISPDDNETNETYETATEIANGEYCFFTLLGEKDTDWFELELTEEFSKLSVEIGTATGRFEAPIVYSVSKYNEETGELDSVGSVWGMYASNALKRDDKRSYNISGAGKYYVRVLNASQANSLYYSGDNESYLYLRCTGINES